MKLIKLDNQSYIKSLNSKEVGKCKDDIDCLGRPNMYMNTDHIIHIIGNKIIMSDSSIYYVSDEMLFKITEYYNFT